MHMQHGAKWFSLFDLHRDGVDSFGIHVTKYLLSIRLHLKHPLLYLFLSFPVDILVYHSLYLDYLVNIRLRQKIRR